MPASTTHDSVETTSRRLPAGALYVGSEVGTLRRVILHRPGLELSRLTPRNKDALLFDDVLWVKRARQEHDAFADSLVERGVEVLYLQDLLSQTLEHPGARAKVIAATMRAIPLGPTLTPALIEWLAALDPGDLASCLIGGVAHHELPFTSTCLLYTSPSPRDRS